MIWVTWRQFRGTILTGILTPLLISAVMMATTLVLDGVRSFGTVFFYCFGYPTPACVAETALTAASLATIALPVLLGVFVGVTVFSRDIERRSHVLGLTQAVSRRRWYWTRILVVFAPIVLAMGVLGLVSYWVRFRSFSGAYAFVGYFDSRLSFPLFGAAGIAPAAYTALSLAVGSALALLLRNTIGAMILTLVTMAAVLLVLPTAIREHYASPEIEKIELADNFYGSDSATYSSNPDVLSQRWLIGSDYIDLNGDPVTVAWDTCPPNHDNWPEARPDETTAEFDARISAYDRGVAAERIDCLRGLGIDHFENRYHPDSLFWRFQLTEAALCLLLAALLAGASARLTRRLQP